MQSFSLNSVDRTTDSRKPACYIEYEISIYFSCCFLQVMAVHSQSMMVPDCPVGWKGLWIGYSFAMVSDLALLKTGTVLLVRDVIYTSRAYAMMPVSVCLSVCL